MRLDKIRQSPDYARNHLARDGLRTGHVRAKKKASFCEPKEAKKLL
jgi:hypothetical protein